MGFKNIFTHKSTGINSFFDKMNICLYSYNPTSTKQFPRKSRKQEIAPSFRILTLRKWSKLKFIVFYPIYCCVILYYNVLAAFVFVTETRAISLTKDKTFLDFSYRQCSRKKMKFGWAGLSSIKLVSLMHRSCCIQSVEINAEY